MVNVGKGGYDTAAEFSVPRLEREDFVHAVRVVCGLAWNTDDAKLLLETLGIPEDIWMEARSDHGRELDLV